MKLIDYKVRDFIYELDSPSPAPGGGSVSALAASMGVALSRMVGQLTIPKKKFKALDEEIQDEVVNLHESIKKAEKQLLDLIDEDTDAFNKIMIAFKMPKETDAEKAKRKKAILEGTIEATKVPEAIADIAFEALKQIDLLVSYGNQNALSDVGVSALMLQAGLEGAILNVKINLPGLDDEAMKETLMIKCDQYLKEGRAYRDAILTKVHERLS